jgi:ABC-type transport system involved in multi-copper enzyme maturation permease subunit
VIPLTLDLLARSRLTLFWWLLGLLSMGAYVVIVFDSIGSLEDLRKLYDSYPESIRELVGNVDISTINGWTQTEFLSWVPLVLGMYGGIFAGGHISREAEQRTVDFILGLPVSRTQFMVSRLLAGLVNLAIICGLCWLLLVALLPVMGHAPAAGKFALALFNAYLLGAALFTAYAFIASFTDEQAKLIGIAIGGTLVLYIATGALRSAGAPDVVQWLVPFDHYHSADAVSGRHVAVLPMVVLAAGTLVGAAAAVYWYNRRDLAV